MLLIGKVPFIENKFNLQRENIFDIIVKKELELDGPEFSNISNRAKTFLKSVLCKNPDKRISAQ